MLTTYSGRNASQNQFELDSFVSFMLGQGCWNYLEVGARHGDTFHHVMRRLGDASRGVALDYPGALWGTSTSGKALTKAANDLSGSGYKVQVVFGDSHDVEVVSAVRKHGPYDFALIDADHSYKAVVKDFEDYSPMADFVAFHDITGTLQSTHRSGYRVAVEVPRLWAELKAQYDCWEFVDTGSQMGIGVIKVNQERITK